MSSGKSTGKAMPSGPKTRQRGSKRKVLRTVWRKTLKRAKPAKIAKAGDVSAGPDRAKLWAEFTKTDAAREQFRNNGARMAAAFEAWSRERKS